MKTPVEENGWIIIPPEKQKEFEPIKISDQVWMGMWHHPCWVGSGNARANGAFSPDMIYRRRIATPQNGWVCNKCSHVFSAPFWKCDACGHHSDDDSLVCTQNNPIPSRNAKAREMIVERLRKEVLTVNERRFLMNVLAVLEDGK